MAMKSRTQREMLSDAADRRSKLADQMLAEFIQQLCEGDVVAALRGDIIGRDVRVPGPEGSNKILFADYAASGRSLRQVERFLQDDILPFYANAHTEASYCGAFMNRVRGEARATIARLLNADESYAVVFAGAGATAGINRLVHLLLDPPRECRSGTLPPLVLIGPYEHHSNILPWRESGAEVVEIPEGDDAPLSLTYLEAILQTAGPARKVIGAFSAASNVTGLITEVDQVNALLKRFGAISVWDYAGGGPYLPIDMSSGGGKDAVVLSPHKCVGGPGASGLLVVRKAATWRATPSLPGGGTVSFVSPWAHHYCEDLAAREEAGTPNVIGDVRAALALMIKAAVGEVRIGERNAELCALAMSHWRGNDRLEILGRFDLPRLPIFSFRVKDGGGGYVHHQAITRMLSDYYGVQARGGCACAGPYAHRLLGITREASEALWTRIAEGCELEKPGWTRVNLSYLADATDARAVVDAVNDLARRANDLSSRYHCDPATARFRYKDDA